MTSEQIILFSLLGAVFALLLWGKIRHDLVAFGALVAAILIGAVPEERAFDGFAHPATVIIALVLVVSRGLSNSGAVELLARHVVARGRSLFAHIGVMSGVAAVLSALMNNVAALALLMPIDIKAASQARRHPGLSLMPLSFASILGGLITLIGTPPNIIIAGFREEALGAPFSMFDFTPVGAVAALAGIAYIATLGWRLIPAAGKGAPGDLFNLEGYTAEVRVGEKSKAIGKKITELEDPAEAADVAIIGLVRGGRRFPGHVRREVVKKGDFLVIEAAADNIDAFVGEFGLEYDLKKKKDGAPIGEDLSMFEVTVPHGARIEGRSALDLRLRATQGVTMLGVARQGRVERRRVRKLKIRAGDVLLLLGPTERIAHVGAWIGGLALQERDLRVVKRDKARLAAGAFAIAIAAAASGAVSLTVALALVCVVMVAANIVPPRDIYNSIEWPVIVLLGSMIPLGAALQSSGGTALIAQALLGLAEGYGAVVVLLVLMAVTMTLSDILNNAATTVIAAPVALDIAAGLGLNPDPFLMAVAVAASCAFLTPIGHKNNTLIMGPGGYRFGDYWRMGLPLEIIILAVAIPMILWVWPL
ncbi:MAG: SLC13 family permease [Arenicellales bacterium IbO2]|nr:SLC13 family permease [Gammaproteobacteria bacterium]MDA7962059.1 SLC13 family permease [Gammaproteobacteria bacterium]MDA7995549.1 SLC13 family permease [Gammaproteobacteria bacterium]MDA8023378.1 SLC13 family permease [Gammaproteobacteria bacterium]CAJ2375929.1 MAG: SLC13 family permease [Arenicellales bacterium IbO2]